MKVITRDNVQGDRIDDVVHWMPDAVRREVRLDPSAYARFTYGWKGGASANWDEVACACDLVNLLYGFSTTTNEGTLLGWLRAKLADRRFMGTEFGTWVYLRHHVEPTLIQLAVSQRLAESRPDPWAEIAEGLTDWLRALVGYLAWTGCWGPGHTWSNAVATDGPGARLLVGKGGPNVRHGGARYSVLAGKRSWHYGGGEWTRNLHAPIYLSALGLGEDRTGGDILPLGTVEAIRAALGWDGMVLTKQERALVAAAITNDESALKWARRELIGDWAPAERVVIVRTTDGVDQMLLAAGKSPTATVYYSGWRSNGTTYAAGACPGGRGAHGEQIEPGLVAFDIANRSGYCQRISGEPRPVVPFGLSPGPLVAVLEIGGGVPTVEHYFIDGQPAPAPAPEPVPTPGPAPAPAPRPPKRGCLFGLIGRK